MCYKPGEPQALQLLHTLLMTQSREGVNELLHYTINFVFKVLSSNSKVGHRNRVNIFDVVKMIRSLNISHKDLKAYINWLSLARNDNDNNSDDFLYSIFSKRHLEVSEHCKIDLAFCVDVNETKKPGFDYLPPTPSSFTFKFTPVTLSCIYT